MASWRTPRLSKESRGTEDTVVNLLHHIHDGPHQTALGGPPGRPSFSSGNGRVPFIVSPLESPQTPGFPCHLMNSPLWQLQEVHECAAGMGSHSYGRMAALRGIRQNKCE